MTPPARGPGGRGIVVVAGDAVPIQDRLDVAGEVEDLRHVGQRFDPAGRPFQCQQIAVVLGP